MIEDTLKQLIKIHSVSGTENQIEGFIFNRLKNLKKKPIWVGGNVVLKIKGLDPTKAIILNAHIDTVSAGDLNSWHTSPYGEKSGQIKDGKMYGLGSSDEKCAAAVLLELSDIWKTGNIPACDVWLTFVISEETTGTGTKSFLDWFSKNHRSKYKDIAALLLEPTGLAKGEIGHRGNVFIKLTTSGDGGHGSKPELVKNHAVFSMFEVLKKVQSIGEKWQLEFDDPILGYPSIAIATSITAGDQTSPNKIAETCVATLDIRTTPKLHPVVLGKLHQELKNVEVEYLYDPAPLGITAVDDPIVQVLKSLLPDIEIGISNGATDQCFFTEKNIPAIVFGPGEKSQMHKPNEYCELEKVKKSVGLYQQIITAWSTYK